MLTELPSPEPLFLMVACQSRSANAPHDPNVLSTPEQKCAKGPRILGGGGGATRILARLDGAEVETSPAIRGAVHAPELRADEAHRLRAMLQPGPKDRTPSVVPAIPFALQAREPPRGDGKWPIV